MADAPCPPQVKHARRCAAMELRTSCRRLTGEERHPSAAPCRHRSADAPSRQRRNEDDPREGPTEARLRSDPKRTADAQDAPLPGGLGSGGAAR